MTNIRFFIKRLLIISTILGLITTNILTLLNNEFHTKLFKNLETILISVIAKETLVRILSHSPTKQYEAIKLQQFEFKQKRINLAKRISKRIALRTEKHALKSVSSFLPKIVPLIGAATTATFTVMEISDDCQTLKDLNELSIDFEFEKTDETTVCGMDMGFLKDYLPD